MIETKFKQTEIGLIPEDWGCVTTSSLAISMNDGPFGSNLKQEHYTQNREARIIQLGNIGDNGWNDENVKYTTFLYANIISKYIVNPGDVLVAKMMPAGRAIICPSHEKCFIQGSDAIKIVFSSNAIIPQYFVYFTKSKAYLHMVEENTQGSTRQRISITKYRNFPCVLPPIKEQTTIVSALTSIDNLLSSLDKLIAKKRDIKQGAMQQLLTGKTRLKGFTEPWRTKILGEYSKIYRGGSPRPIEAYLTDSADGVNWIKIGDVKAGSKYINKTNERIKPSGVPMSRKVYVGDFILSNSMSFGRPYILNIDGCIHDGWLVIQDYQETFDKDFLYYALGSDDVFKQYISMAAGSSVKNLNKDKVANVVLSVPKTKSEQQAIASVLSSIDNEIAALEAKRKKYEAVKQGMMQQLLTGKIRLK
jgi:type I restriction enzyme S subunit